MKLSKLRLPSTLQSLRRVRRVSLVTLVLIVALFVITLDHEFGFRYGNEYYGILGDGCVQVGSGMLHAEDIKHIDFPAPSSPPKGDFRWVWLRFRSNVTFAASWRPFMISSADFKAIAIPLWPLILVANLALLWSHGAVRSLARPSGVTCRHCSYDLSGHLPAHCPECGKAQREPEAPAS